MYVIIQYIEFHILWIPILHDFAIKRDAVSKIGSNIEPRLGAHAVSDVFLEGVQGGNFLHGAAVGLLSASSGELMVRYHGSIKFLLGVPLIVILIDLLLRHPLLIGQYFL